MKQSKDLQNESTNPTFERSSEPRSSESVRRAMTPNPATVQESDSLIRAAELMVEHDCGAIPVVEGRRVVGMITDRDIVTRIVARKEDPGDKRVSDAMSQGAHTIREDEDLDRAFEIMSQHKIRRLAVVDANGNLCGMIAQADLALDSHQDRRLAETVEEISERSREERT